MRVSFRLLFVGWWMAGLSWMVTGVQYPKPSVSMSPEVVTLGGNVTVFCGNASDPQAEFLLYKRLFSSPPLVPQTTKDNHAEFIISITSISDAGVYDCVYYLGSGTEVEYSDYSDGVYINVTDPSLCKPSIKVRPEGPHDTGTKITIECKGPHSGLTFSLHRSEDLPELQRMKAEGDTAKFSLSPLRPEDAGNYTCQYYHKENPFVHSEPSDHVQVVVIVSSSTKFPACLGVAGFVLLALVLIVAEAVYSWRKGQP